jgi:hypothetical protein
MSSNSVNGRWSAGHHAAQERRDTMTTKRHRTKIARESPPPGITLTGRFKGQTYSATIVEEKDLSSGRAVEYDGSRYTSLSAAARAITGHPINGWRFWHTNSQQ